VRQCCVFVVSESALSGVCLTQFASVLRDTAQSEVLDLVEDFSRRSIFSGFCDENCGMKCAK